MQVGIFRDVRGKVILGPEALRNDPERPANAVFSMESLAAASAPARISALAPRQPIARST